jgi:hypothetical protein
MHYLKVQQLQKPRRTGKSPTYYAKPTVETSYPPEDGGLNA